MFRSSITVVVATGPMLSACAAALSGGAASSTTLQKGERLIDDISGGGVIDASKAALIFGPDVRSSGNCELQPPRRQLHARSNRADDRPVRNAMMACPRADGPGAHAG